jgi:hypothetical protein
MTRGSKTKPQPNHAAPSTPVQDFRELDDRAWDALIAELRNEPPPFDFGDLEPFDFGESDRPTP